VRDMMSARKGRETGKSSELDFMETKFAISCKARWSTPQESSRV
jgi:hypothetical protein